MRQADRVHVARAELVLARSPQFSPKALPIRPDDPLQPLANALGDVRPDLGETVDVCIDLVPLTPARMRHVSRKYQPSSGSAGGLLRAVGEGLAEVAGEFLLAARGQGLFSSGPARAPLQQNKFLTDEPVFATVSEIPGRAEACLRSVIGAFDVYRGENYWRMRGVRFLGRQVGADVPVVRRLFDRRFATGLAKPRPGSLVTARRPPSRVGCGRRVPVWVCRWRNRLARCSNGCSIQPISGL